MTEHIQRRAKELFIEACMLDQSARSAFLEQTCVGEVAMRAEVESLLQNHDEIVAADELQAGQRESHSRAELADVPGEGPDVKSQELRSKLPPSEMDNP